MTKTPNKIYFAGIDIGSTTAKVTIFDKEDDLVFWRYRRHQAKAIETVRDIFNEAILELGDVELDLAVTGSAGMGVAEVFGLPFVQEVVASAYFIEKFYPEVRTFIEIGGEDSKIIFFDDHFRPDIRMNGSCAGGTGAFIDQMAVLLDVGGRELNALAKKSTNIYPIASRCGVFAKTDIQSMLSRHVSKEDIAASIFHAVALQVLTALSRGREIKKKILFGGGPLTFYSKLRRAFIDILDIKSDSELVISDHCELLPAMGAAMIRNGKPFLAKVSNILSVPENGVARQTNNDTKRLPPLFESKAEFETWQEKHAQAMIPRVNPAVLEEKNLFLGVDSGSTTTKIVLIDEEGKLALGYYNANNGDPIQAVKEGLGKLKKRFAALGFSPRIVRTAVTGYGEDLIKAAFGLDDGVIETMAHYRAARQFEPNVSFILDIGGQDMKAIYIHNLAVAEIQVNEACSSGCGSFIETFARSLGYNVQEFAKIACEMNSPFDLGTRCTVFMNSKVKQALREGATVSDISTGLAYSVIKNALYKVLKLKNIDVLGNKIVVQGGTFRNAAVLRALELSLNKDVIRPDISELMGAYGAALTAIVNYQDKQSKPAAFTPIWNQELKTDFSKKEIHCNGCENKCAVLKLTFANRNCFYTGNRCERYFSNNPDVQQKGNNLVDEQTILLFDRNKEPEKEPILTYGLPRCLNMYENFPFWCAFLTTCGFRVVLSSPSNFNLYEKGACTVMSENICFPAKLAHGHIFDLVEKKVDRIFYPTVVCEQEEYEDVLNTYNCPVVTGYPDLLKSAVNPKQKFGIPLDSPAISFKDSKLLRDQLYLFFKLFGIDYWTISRAVEKGHTAQKNYKGRLRARAKALIAKAEEQGKTIVVLAGRPYHQDPLINHGIPQLLAEQGVDVISENALPLAPEQVFLDDINVLTQWSYTNRLYAAAKWVTQTPNAQLVQLTSFGCGPDAIATDEVGEILRGCGKIYTLLKMDEITNLGAVKIRLRSMLETVKENAERVQRKDKKRKIARTLTPKDKEWTLIAPFFSPFYSPLIPSAFRPLGYRVEVLPPQDKASVELGLKTINNDMCYPSILVAGDIIKAFQSGLYDPEKTAVILTQTGGQCRASSYVPLIKKGLNTAGLDTVPVISISYGGVNSQPDFEIDEKGLVKRLALGVIFADPLAQMYLSTVPREKNPGASKALHSKYLSKMETGIENADYYYLLNLLKKAIADFNRVEIKKEHVPKIGVVGEIFVKYNFFSNGNIIEWLSNQGVEVILPPLQSFFAQKFINEAYAHKALFKHSLIDYIKTRMLEIYTNFYLGQIKRVMQGFRFYRKSHDLRKLSEITSEVVSLANQFGEGWLLAAEMIAMLGDGISNIVCLQPFGCISNHITGRGMENKLREMYPQLNLLSLDMDAGASEVNILNRLHFMVMRAREQINCEAKTPVGPKATRRFSIPRPWPRELNVFYNYVSLDVEKWKSWVSGLELWEKTRNIRFRIGR
ncbi:2-hydroxyacyl-CoA dehydratase [Desulfohalobiaceae bacterium Ax17]|uniref:acyl-CoA dehydratase activase-related protein n=1 Tax=Desulfovulcanus ferrireducens TaxID=2831190 RepID=UPI00207BCEA2|nr:acyl-CoA dehydratase activase-related protein [Desulfovulcanus ferrireducens]MBT8762723.1 2-hydroxyacyl-CoA dehydratase [Desulfovulcanus ferrireducens]